MSVQCLILSMASVTGRCSRYDAIVKLPNPHARSATCIGVFGCVIGDVS